MRGITVTLAALGILSLVACGPDQADDEQQPKSNDVQTAAPTTVSETAATPAKAETKAEPTQSAQAQRLPRLVDLGATTCRPCQMMEPVLESLREDYRGRMDVIFIDVRQDPEAARPYNIQSIPTQIYYDANGAERWRHVGYISKEDLLTNLEDSGIVIPSE